MFGIGLLAITHVLVVLIFTIGSLILGISFMVRPVEKKLGLIKPATWASVLSILSATATGFSNSFLNSTASGSSASMDTVLMVNGFAEALVPAIFGFGVLSLAWMFVFIGLRRLD